MSGSHPRSQLSLAFRRGAESHSHTLRSATGHSLTCALDVDDVVAHLGLEVVSLSELGSRAPRAAFRLYASSPSVFSAAAVCTGGDALGIVYNDANDPVRQRADIAHECAHVLLGHAPSTATDSQGMRIYPEAEEVEASWLGPTLLVPRAGLISVLQETGSLEDAAAHFHVSVPLARFVYNTRGCSRYVKLRG